VFVRNGVGVIDCHLAIGRNCAARHKEPLGLSIMVMSFIADADYSLIIMCFRANRYPERAERMLSCAHAIETAPAANAYLTDLFRRTC
jgi:hypothetical protein